MWVSHDSGYAECRLLRCDDDLATFWTTRYLHIQNSSLRYEDGDNTCTREVHKYLPDYTASRLRRWQSHISYYKFQISTSIMMQFVVTEPVRHHLARPGTCFDLQKGSGIWKNSMTCRVASKPVIGNRGGYFV
jgi:hypothetical protein